MVGYFADRVGWSDPDWRDRYLIGYVVMIVRACCGNKGGDSTYVELTNEQPRAA